jgi:hypothetical protein
LEEKRIKELEYYEIMNTSDEEDNNEIMKLYSYICGKSISLINFVNINKIWVKSQTGIEGLTDLNRKESFCHLTINNKKKEIFEIKNTKNDIRIKYLDIPAPEDLRFKYYAGFPLTTVQVHNIGPLCVLDYQPGEMTKEQKNALSILASQLIKMIELNKRNKELKKAGQKLIFLQKQ